MNYLRTVLKTTCRMSIIGIKIVGYRYGKAPESGKSYNCRDCCYECGVSMASVGYDREIGSFAVSGARTNRKYYYAGVICGTGGDDEICLEDVEQITREDYLRMRAEMKEASNKVVNDRYDRKINLIHKGYNIGLTEDEVERERNRYLK